MPFNLFEISLLAKRKQNNDCATCFSQCTKKLPFVLKGKENHKETWWNAQSSQSRRPSPTNRRGTFWQRQNRVRYLLCALCGKAKRNHKEHEGRHKEHKGIRANPFNLRIPCAILFVFPALLGMSETQKGEFRTRPYNP